MPTSSTEPINTEREQRTLRRPSRHGPAMGSPRLSRSVEETSTEATQQPLRPILSAKSRSVDSSPVCGAQQRRNVSFQLPERRDSAASRMAALAQRVKQLTISAASPSASRSKPKKSVKTILRQPVVHVYLRGASGLPTQRVPLSAVYRVSRDFRASSVS